MAAGVARSKTAARDRYRRVLQETLSCVSDAVFVVQPAIADDKLVLESKPLAIKLKRGADKPLWLQFGQEFHFIKRGPRDWKVKTDAYAYTLSDTENLSRELISWHWHPASRKDTHLHVGKGHPESKAFGSRLHVPTGRVAFEEVVAFAIVDLGVLPVRSDWEDRLAHCLKRFVTHRSWP